MKRWIRKGIVFVAGVFLAFLLIFVIGSLVGASRFKGNYREEKEYLLHCARSGPYRTGKETPVASLPRPLRKYLQVSGSVDKRPLKLAILKQRGALRAAPEKPWIPFEAEQAYSFWRPGFIWMANARMAPLARVYARDKFIEGQGSMLVSLFGLVKVADMSGPEMNLSAGVRYWSEIICFPEAVRSPYLRWEAMNERQARLHISQWGLEMKAVIEFDAKGLLAAMHAERYRSVNGSQVLTPWSGYLRDWKEIDGRLFPGNWESVWRLPEGDFSAVRIEILGIQTE